MSDEIMETVMYCETCKDKDVIPEYLPTVAWQRKVEFRNKHSYSGCKISETPQKGGIAPQEEDTSST